MRSIPAILVFLVSLAAAPAPLPAQEDTASVAAAPQSRLFGARDKLRRGIANSATGWLELPYTTFSEVVFGERSPFERLFVGLAVGSAKAIQRTAVGVFETATFVIPSYDPLLKPEYVSLSFKAATASAEPEAADPRAGLHVKPPQSPLNPSSPTNTGRM